MSSGASRSHGPWAHNLCGGRGSRRCPHLLGSGVAQVFHVLLVELRLLLVAEVEERERQEEGLEVESGVGRVKEKQPCG